MEGYATGVTVHTATGWPVACAFDAGNLLPVALALRVKFPATQIVIAADNDAVAVGKTVGVGFEKATEAARAVNGRVLMPDQVGFDWNDVHVAAGLDAVRALFEGALA